VNITTIRGHELAWSRHGESGPRVLLIMGFGMSSDAWRPQVDGLSDRLQLVRYDNRGIHRSSAGVGPHDLRGLAADAAGLLDHLGWPDAHIVGISMGGMVAQHFALDHRHRTRSLTLIATHAGGGLRHTRPSLRAIRLFVKANLTRGPERLAALSELLFTPAWRDALRAKGWSADQLSTVAQPSDRRVRLAHLRAMLRNDVRRRLPLLAGLPVLVIRPDADQLVPPRLSDEIASLIPGARLVSVRSGHGALMEATEAVNNAIADHILRVEAAAR
jgi:3-oxoadipate enol-lactonase